MKKWTLVDKTLTLDGKTLSLHEHDGSYTIRVDGAELMSTRQHASEERLAELAALSDALLQDPARQSALLEDLIEPLALAQQARRDAVAAKAAATRVQFFAMRNMRS